MEGYGLKLGYYPADFVFYFADILLILITGFFVVPVGILVYV